MQSAVLFWNSEPLSADGDLAAGGGPKRSLGLGIPAGKKTLARQEWTTLPELATFLLLVVQRAPVFLLRFSF